MRFNRIDKILSIPLSFFLCCKLCGIKKAFKIPVLLRYNSTLINTKGKIAGDGKIDIGFGDISIYDKKYYRSIIDIHGTIELDGYSHFGPGTKICVEHDAILSLGDNIANSAGCTIVCTKLVKIGSNCIISWDTLFLDNDYHKVQNITTQEIYNHQAPIIIGENVWIGARSILLKGTYIANNCIVAANTTICKQFKETNCLLAGCPALIKKRNVIAIH